MVQSFSPIQNQIITKLKNADRLRYSDLQIKGVPNDLFNYHLQYLVKKKYLNRAEEGYSLAEAGIKHVADPDIDGTEKIASLFKVNVITVVSRISNGKIEILSQKRKSHPSFGKIGVMGGIVRKGESVEDAAHRKLEVETGLQASLRLLGIQRRITYKKNKLFSDIFFPITYTDTFSGELKAHTNYGENFWVDINTAITNESVEFDSLIKLVDVLKAIKSNALSSLQFFYEEDTQSQP